MWLLAALLLVAACSGRPTRPSKPVDASTPSRVTATPTVAASPPATSEPAPPAATLLFAAGGSIYSVDADGSHLQKLVDGSPDGLMNSAWSPSLSPDGTRLAFVQGYNIWVADADGSHAHQLAVARTVRYDLSLPGVPFAIGVDRVAWSPDGTRLLYGMSRIGGSGVNEVWTMAADGTDRRLVAKSDAAFMTGTWVSSDRVAVSASNVSSSVTVFGLDGSATTIAGLVAGSGGIASEIPGDRWVVGSFHQAAPIRVGTPNAMRAITAGVAPVPSPDGGWIAFLAGATLRVMRNDGTANREVVDLAALGGLDFHFGFSREPVVAWAPSGSGP